MMLMLALVGAPGLAAPPSDVVPAAAPEDVVRAWVAAVNRADPDAAIALYADDAAIEALGQEIRGKAAIAGRQRTIIAPVLRPHVEIERLAVDGEAVTVRFLGENAITRFDGRGPVHATTTFYLRDGLIQREVGPVLDSADAAWYADAMHRFRATGALPQRLPSAGRLADINGPVSVAAAFLGVSLLGVGIVHLRRRSRPSPADPGDGTARGR
jgi:ketosteroid isomerase-like protein